MSNGVEGYNPELDDNFVNDSIIAGNISEQASYDYFSDTPTLGRFGAGESKYDKGVSVENIDQLESIRNQGQSGIAQFGNSLNQAIIGEVVGGTIEGIGYLIDLKDTYDALINGQVEVGNKLSEIGKSLKEWTKDVTPIYSDPFKEGQFAPEDWSWWMSNMPSVASTFSLMLPSGAAVKGLGYLGKGTKAAAMLAKNPVLKMGVKGVTQATISRQMEAMMEASQLSDQIPELISKGVDPEKAKEIVAKEQAKLYKAEWAMLLQDIAQYTTLVKPFGKATSDLTIKTAKRLGKNITPVITNKLAAVGKDMVGEAAEEGYQYIIGERAREMTEYRAGLRTKRSLGESAADYMGDGDFWTGAFFGALGAGAMQTGGKGLNMAKERIRDSEDSDTKRMRDIDSWGQSIQGLANLDATGEAMGSPKFNSKNRQLAEFGTKLAQNGNLGWFLETANNFQNMSEEDQQMFGFTPEDLKASKEQFPTLTQDLEKIGNIYEDVVNNKSLHPTAVGMLTQEQFLADKTLEQYNKADGQYSTNVGNITGLSNLDAPPSTRDLIIKEELELTNLLKVRKDLKDNNASKEVISEYDTRISEIREEIKEDKKNLSTFAEHKYKTFNLRATDFQKESSSFRSKEFLSAEHKSAMEAVDYYSDPEKTKELVDKITKVQNENLKTASDNATTAKEVSDQEDEVNNLNAQAAATTVENQDQGTEETLQSSKVFDPKKNNKKKAAEQAEESNTELESKGKTEYDNINDAADNKYTNKPHLLNEDINKIIAYGTTQAKKDFSREELEDLIYEFQSLSINLASKNIDALKNSLIELSLGTELQKKLYNNLMNIINSDAKKAAVNKTVQATEDSMESSKTTSVGTEEEKSGISISETNKETHERTIKNRAFKNFFAVNRIAGKGAKELGIDQEDINNGEVKIGDKVTFRVDKADPYEKTNRGNVKTRGFNIVSKGVIIGKVPISQTTLRETLQAQIEAKYDKSARYVEADITSEVAGAKYKYTKGETGTPNQKISKKDQAKFRSVGGFALDFAELKGDEYHLSGKTGLDNLGITVTEKFTQKGKAKIDGAFVLVVPHPIESNENLFIRGFLNTLSSIESNNNQLYTGIRTSLVELFNEYASNKSKRAATRTAIKEIIIRDFEVKGDNILLFKRGEGRNTILPIDGLTQNPEFIAWLEDSKIRIDKNKLNTESDRHTFGSYESPLMPYNKLISDMIGVTTKDGQYITEVQMMIKEVNITSQPKTKVEKVSSEVKTKERNPLELDEDPSKATKETKEKKTNTPESKASTPIVKKERKVKVEKPKLNLKPAPTKNNVSDSQALKDQVNKNKGNKKYRPVADIDYKKWNKSEEIAWMKKNFPGIDVSILENLQEVAANGREAWGVFHNAAIYVAENAASGTLYHEAFHGLFNLFNTPEQRAALLKEAAKKYNVPRGKYATIEDYNVALEEVMADDFMEYVIFEEAPKSLTQKVGKAISNFFRKLQGMIKSLYTNPVYSIDELFWKGNNGFYKDSVVDPGSFSEPMTRYRVPDWAYRQEKQAIAAVNGHLANKILNKYRENPDYSNLSDTQIINEAGIEEVYKSVYNDFLEVYTENDGLTEEEHNNLGELLLNFYQDGEFKSLYDGLLRGLEFYDIKVNFSKYNKTVSEIGEFDSEDAQQDDLREADEKAQDKIGGISDSATERSTKDNALKEVKVFIRNMQLDGYKNIFGLNTLVDYQETYDTLLKNLAGTTKVSDMEAMLTQDAVTYPEYQQILDAFENTPEFKTKFFSAFNKNHTKYNIISFINGNWAVYQANRKGLANTIISQWTESILSNKDVITINSKGETIVNPKTKDIVADIRENITSTLEGWTKEKDLDYYKPLSESLGKLGISIEPKVLHYIGSVDNSRINGKGSLNKFFNGAGKFHYILTKFDDLKNPFDAEGGLDAGETEAIKNAANMVAKASPDLYESSFRNLGGKTVYAHLEQNFLTKLTHKLQNPDNRENVIDNYMKDQFFYESDSEGGKVLTNRILKKLKEGKDIFDIMVTEGMTDDQGNRTAYQKLDATGLKLYTIHNYFNNGNQSEAWYRGPVLSDAPNGIVFKHLKEKRSDTIKALVNIAGSEYNRIQSIDTQLKELNKNEYIKNYHIPENANTDTGYHIISGMRNNSFNPNKDRAKAAETIEKWLLEKADAYYNSMKESGVLKRLDERITNKYNTEESLKEFVEDFFINDFAARAEFTLMTVGDPAFYKSSEEGNNKTVDFIKRAKEIYSPKSILDVDAFYIDKETGEKIEAGAKYGTVYLADNEIESPSWGAIKKAINSIKGLSKAKKGDIIKSYGKVNQTDAQAYITLPFYRKTMISMGRWTNLHQAAYKRLEKGLGTGEDIALMMQPLKPFAYGQIYADKLGRLVPVQNKNSEYLLLPQLALETNSDGDFVNDRLANLYNYLTENKIDSANFDSAVKAGLSKVINPNILPEYHKNQVHVLNMEDRGIQQEVPEHFVDSNNLFGSQLRKLIMSDLFDGTTYFGEKDAATLRKDYEDILMADLEEAFNDVSKEFVDAKGEIKYKDVYELLLDEARKRGKGEEFEKAIQYDEKNNRLKLPLSNPITSRSAQNLITSVFKTRITKQKTAGGSFVQLSSYGLSKELKLVFNEDDGLNHAEVMLPAWSKEFFKDFMNTNGDVDFASIEKNIPEALEMIGYRIPTEDKYSMLPMKVIGFLPYTAGGAIMLPADITQISGSDFDVDKMYVMMKSFEVDRKISKDNFNIIASKLKVTPKELAVTLKKNNDKKELTEDEIKLVESYKEFDKTSYVDEVTYKIHKFNDAKSAKENSKPARDNRKIDLMMSVLQNPNTLDSILSGGTFKPLQDIAEITAMKTGKSIRDLDPISASSMDSMHIDNMTGKSLVPVAANENSFHAIAQHANLSLKTAINFDKLSLTSLSGTKAKTYVYVDPKTGVVKLSKKPDNKISKNKAYYLAAVVDNAKDPVASYINYNSYTSGIVGLLTQAGLDPATVTWFLKQPIIQDITDKFFASSEDYTEESNIINKYKEKFEIKKDPEIAPNLDTTKLFDNLNKTTDHTSQKEVFEAFLVYKKLAKDWTALVLASRADTKGFGPTLADSENITHAISKVMDENFGIDGAADLFNIESTGTRLIASFTEYGINKPLEIANKMFPYADVTGLYIAVKDRLSESIKNRELSVKERNLINDQVTSYLLSKFTAFNPNERVDYINKFPKEFLEFSEKNSIFADNYLVRRLTYQSAKSDKKTPIERIMFNNTGSLNNEQKNDIQKAWLDLYENPEFRDMADKLFKYTYFTTGMAFGANGFSHLMPVDLLTDNGIKDNNGVSLADFMWELQENNMTDAQNAIEFEEQFYRNNYKNKTFVPRVNEESTNVTKTHKDKKGNIIGFTVAPNVKDNSFILKESENEIVYSKFITFEKDGNIELYENRSQGNVATYVLAEKLGFPNYIFEYLQGASSLSSSLDINKVTLLTVTDVLSGKGPAEKIQPVTNFTEGKKEVKGLKAGKFENIDASITPTKEYKVEFTIMGKKYIVIQLANNKLVDSKGEPLLYSNSKSKLFRSALVEINKETC